MFRLGNVKYDKQPIIIRLQGWEDNMEMVARKYGINPYSQERGRKSEIILKYLAIDQRDVDQKGFIAFLNDYFEEQVSIDLDLKSLGGKNVVHIYVWSKKKRLRVFMVEHPNSIGIHEQGIKIPSISVE